MGKQRCEAPWIHCIATWTLSFVRRHLESAGSAYCATDIIKWNKVSFYLWDLCTFIIPKLRSPFSSVSFPLKTSLPQILSDVISLSRNLPKGSASASALFCTWNQFHLYEVLLPKQTASFLCTGQRRAVWIPAQWRASLSSLSSFLPSSWGLSFCHKVFLLEWLSNIHTGGIRGKTLGLTSGAPLQLSKQSAGALEGTWLASKVHTDKRSVADTASLGISSMYNLGRWASQVSTSSITNVQSLVLRPSST